MTEDEFQNKYHHFETTDIKEATVEAVKINAVAEEVDDFYAQRNE